MIDWTVRQTICGLSELPALSEAGITHLLSIIDPITPEPGEFDAAPPQARLTLRFHDIIAPEPGLAPPEAEHIEALLAFGRTLPDSDPAHLLVHCHMGVSRSTAAMAALLVEAHPDATGEAVLAHLTRIRPQAWPNSRMIAFADDQLGRGGLLLQALARLYRRQLQRYPHFAEGLRSGGRGVEVEMAEAA